MAERIDPINASKWVQWALIAMVCDHDARDPEDRVPLAPGQGIEIEMRINGKEVSFQHVIDRMHEGRDRHVREAARELLAEKQFEVEEIIRRAFERAASLIGDEPDEG